MYDLTILSETRTVPVASNDQTVNNELERTWNGKIEGTVPTIVWKGISKTVEDPRNQTGQVLEMPL